MKRRYGVGRIVSVIGILILCVGLLCNSFELISTAVFRAVVLVGIIVNLIAVCIIVKRDEF